VRGAAPLALAITLVAPAGGLSAATPKQPPAQVRLLFAGNATGVLQIYSVTASGKTVAQLTFGPTGAAKPLPSPDGRHVAFRRGTGLWVMAADGSDQHMLVARATDPAWASDSKRLAFVTAKGAIRVVSINGIFGPYLDPGPGDSQPAWAPRGRGARPWILFLRGGELWAAHDGVPMILARGAAMQAWSPDGLTIAYEHGQEIDLVTGAAVPRKLVGLASAYSAAWPAWSPDGRVLVLVDGGKVVFVDAKTGAAHNVDLSPPAESDRPSWAPDGTAVAFRNWNRGDPGQDIRVATLAGQVRTLLPSYPYNGFFRDLAWTHAPGGLHYRAPERVEIQRVSADELAARAPIDALSADGDLVAYLSCGHVSLWRPSTGSVVPIGPGFVDYCGHPELRPYESPYSAQSIALAGSSVALAVEGGGIQRHQFVYAATFARPLPTLVASEDYCCAGRLIRPIGPLLGGEGLLVYSRWHCTFPGCWPADVQGIWALNQSTTEQVASAPNGLEALAVDAGRIVDRRGDGSLELRDASGALVRAFAFTKDEVLAAALSGSDLFALTADGLRDYDTGSGSLLRTRRIDPAARLSGVAHGLLAYVVHGDVHLLRLDDGADAVVASGTTADLTADGLFYAYEGLGTFPGRIHFVPSGALPLP
jgi:hypothetical protein